MNLLFIISLFIFGTLFGSFASVVIYRLKSQEKGIISGRSHCFNCKRLLNAIDLIPIVSFIISKGKCNKCNSSIPYIYPLLELSMGVIFVLIGFFLIDLNLILGGSVFEIIKLLYWLVIGFITILYIFYDILFYEIHEGIMLVGVIIAVLGIILNSLGYELIGTLSVVNGIDLSILLSSSLIGILIIVGLYVIMLLELDTLYDILIILSSIVLIILFKYLFSINTLGSIPFMSSIVGALGIFIFFYLQILFSKGRALGGGDLRIGIMVGLLLGISYSFPGMLLVYLIGSILSILIVLGRRIINKKVSTIVPFCPFIGLGFFATIFLKKYIEKFIEIYFLSM